MDLEWTGAGPKRMDVTNDRYTGYSGCRYKDKSKGMVSEASVAGQVVLDGQELDRPVYASIYKYAVQELVVSCP